MIAPTVIRCSSLSGYPDCGRRTAARVFRKLVEAMGFKLRETPQSIGASVGTGVHAGAALLLKEKMERGALPPLSAATDCAIQSIQESAKGGVLYDRETPALNIAEQQAVRMVHAYRETVAPKIEPIAVEERLEAQVTPTIILSGQSDTIAREPGAVRDLKTGKRRGNHKPQIGGYGLLERTHNRPVVKAVEDFLPRVSIKKPQPPGEEHRHDLAAAESAAMNVIHRMTEDLNTFMHGSDELRIRPGDPWAFPANPSSMLCSAKWCPAHGTQFCVEHQKQEETDSE